MLASSVEFIANSLTITVLVAYVFALWAALLVWTWFDISARTDNPLYRLGAVLIVATGSVLGFAIYLLLRPTFTREESEMHAIEEAFLASQSQLLACPSCRQAVREDFAFCPSCSHKLQEECPGCSREIAVVWDACPYCGRQKTKLQPEKTSQVAPAVQMFSEKEPHKRIIGATFLSTITNLLRKREDKQKSGRKTRAKVVTKNKVRKTSPKRKKA